MSEERIRLEPEPTPAEAAAVQQALEALGLIEPAEPQRHRTVTNRARHRTGV